MMTTITPISTVPIVTLQMTTRIFNGGKFKDSLHNFDPQTDYHPRFPSEPIQIKAKSCPSINSLTTPPIYPRSSRKLPPSVVSPHIATTPVAFPVSIPLTNPVTKCCTKDPSNRKAKSSSCTKLTIINIIKCQHVTHKRKHVGNKSKKKVKKKSNTSKTNTLLKC